MTGIVANVSLGILTNVLYDIIKFAGIKLYGKTSEKDIRTSIEEELYKQTPEDIKSLLESSTFVSFFKSAYFIDIIKAYLEHKIICNSTGEHKKIQTYLNKSGIVTADDIVSHIGECIRDLYEKNETLTVPDLTLIKRTIRYIIEVSEKVMAKNLTTETSQLLYLLNSRTDVYHEQIIATLNKLQNTIEIIQDKQPTDTSDSFEETRLNYHKILKEKNSDAHIYLLDKFPFNKFYVPPILQRDSIPQSSLDALEHSRYRNRFCKWKDIFQKNNIVYLTGGAGYGKSLFTKKIINNYTDLNIFDAESYIVIYGELKSFYPNGSDSSISVIEFLRESIRASTLLDVSSEFVEFYLNSGRCIILLDALDEVDKNKRITLHETVVAFFKNQNPNNLICITSRDRGFIPEKNIEVFKICPLNESQIEKYVDKIIALGKFEKDDKDVFMAQSQALVEKGFLNSFLVLSLLINIYKAERELPSNKLELYQKCFEYIANKREREKTPRAFDWKMISPIMKDNTFIELSEMGMPNNSNIDKEAIKARLLRVYKSKYPSEADAENAIDEFLKFCSDRTELFVPTTEDKFKFFHRSFFEYFYSLYIFLRCSSELDILEELLKFDVDSEVFELTVAMLKQKSEMQYQALIELMFTKTQEEFDNKTNDFSVFNILILSMQVVDDAMYKNEFLNILIDKKDIILEKSEFIYNLRLVSTIFDNDATALQSISDAYNDESKMFLYASCDKLFTIADEFFEEHGESFFEKFFKRIPYGEMFYYPRFGLADANKNFYLHSFYETCDCKKLLLEATKDELLHIYKLFSPRNYKKRTAHTQDSIEKFKEFSSQEQEDFLDFIFSGSPLVV